MTAWPAELPAIPVAGYQEKPPDTTLRTPMDSGAAKQRRRFTANVRPIVSMLLLNETELRIFDDFYVSDLQGGALPFEWVHPRYADQSPAPLALFRFSKLPQYSSVGLDLYQVQIELEILP